MSGKSWRQKKDNGKTFIIKIVFDKGVYEFLISDLVFLWTKSYSEVELTSVCERLNPLFESDSGSLVSKALSLLDDHFHAKGGDLQIPEGRDGCLHLKLKAKLEGIAFKFEVELKKQPPYTFYEKVIVPFLLGAEELVTRQNLLFTMLENKDKEIAEYELEGAKITRRNIKTTLFSREEFLCQSHSSSTKPQDLQCFLDTIKVNEEGFHSETVEVQSPVKQLPSNKDEPSVELPEKIETVPETKKSPEPIQLKMDDKIEARPAKKKRTQLRL